MHDAAARFLAGPATDLVPWWEGMVVLEVGAQIVNDRARDFLPDGIEYVGMDLVAGPDVQYVGDAAVLLADATPTYDAAISTEVLEHAEQWEAIVHGMVRAVHENGWVVITCGGPGRPPHGAAGSATPAPGEYYGNVSIEALTAVLERAGATVVYGEENTVACDTYVLALKESVAGG